MSAPPDDDQRNYTAEELAACLKVLAALHDAPADDPTLTQVERASAHLRKRTQKQRRAERRRRSQADDHAVLARAERAGVSLPSPEPVSGPVPGSVGTLRRERRCYVCRSAYREVHAFYHALCPDCASENFARRTQRADLGGRRALVTGGRIKIGFHTALKLLRDGAHVTVTTRFPHDAARRFAALPDASAFRGRLRIVGIDLRSLPAVLAWTDSLRAEGEPLDILINNAAQTVRRPPAYYAALRADEAIPLEAAARMLLADEIPTVHSALDLSRAAPEHELFPPDRYDDEGLPLDLRPENSWTARLGDVSAVELVETHVVNALVPFVLASRLRPLMLHTRAGDRYVINVSAMEGQFARAYKTTAHPHTNMAKAALNMLTRTSADECARDGIYLCSVDTGWVTDENPHPKKSRLRAQGFRPPLDMIDGAARVYDPIVRGVAGSPVYGCFLKDYRPTAW